MMSVDSRPRIAFTMGDPAGIGPELFVRTLSDAQALCRPVLFGSADLVERALKHESLSCDFQDLEIVEIPLAADTTPGKICPENGMFVCEAIRQAVDACLSGDCRALVTGPISKKAMSLAGLPYPGHTEMLADFAEVDRTMMLFHSPAFSVVLHTIHVPLREVSVDTDYGGLLERIRFATSAYGQLVGDDFEVRVCGVNPHAGEQGRLGIEDAAVEKAVSTLGGSGMRISGPFPADTLFARIPRDGSCLVYAMYHDQGLIPIKTLYPHLCVNMTLGLPFIRASVSHGTAFDIAWQHQADIRNHLQTVKTAVQFSRRKT